MNAVWFIVRAAAAALITVIGGRLVVKKLGPKPSNLAAGAIFFRNGIHEFQKGARTLFFGPPKLVTPEAAKARRESARIPIE